jgi:hypothetical protein
MSRGRLILGGIAAAVVVAAVAVGVGLSSGPSSPEAGPLGSGTGGKRHFGRLGFATNCLWVTSVNEEDEWGGVPGASRNGRPGSSCLRPGYDASVIEAPVLRVGDLAVTPELVFAYYLAPKHPSGPVQVPPSGMSLTGSVVQFQCGDGGSRTNKPVACLPGVPTLAWVTMPSCWAGGSSSYPPCPSGLAQYPVIQLEFKWPSSDITGGSFAGEEGNQFEAVWTNGWLPEALTPLVRDCIQTPTPCGSIVNYFHRSPLPK